MFIEEISMMAFEAHFILEVCRRCSINLCKTWQHQSPLTENPHLQLFHLIWITSSVYWLVTFSVGLRGFSSSGLQQSPGSCAKPHSQPKLTTRVHLETYQDHLNQTVVFILTQTRRNDEENKPEFVLNGLNQNILSLRQRTKPLNVL